MIQKVSANSIDSKKHTPLLIKDKSTPAFTGVADLLIRGMQKCEAEPMLNVTVLDLSTAIIPRSIIETVAASKQKDENGNVIRDENGKPKRKFNILAGFEALRREGSGLLINCIIPGFIVMGAADLFNGRIMGKKSNLINNWADRSTLKTINEFYKGKGAENYTAAIKDIFMDLKGADGSVVDKSFKDIYNSDSAAFDDLFKSLGELADADKLDKQAVKKAISNVVSKTNISENIKFTRNNPDGKYFGNSLEALLKNTVEVLHDAKHAGIESADDFAKYIEKAKKLVKWKSIGGLSIVIPLALAAQPINRWITHKSAGGKKGAPLYNDNEERVLSPEDKKQLLKQKFISIGSMLGLSWLSMMKLPTMQMLEFKKFFPSMDQARLISTMTFASRMGASEDFNDLRESTVRDLATFASFYFLGDYAAKAIASFLEWKHKGEGVELINDLKPLKEGANVFEKFWHWTKHTALKSTSELKTEHLQKLRSVCQLGNLTFSLISLGVFIPLINRIQTNKNEQKRKAELANGVKNASPEQAAASQASAKPDTKKQAVTATGASSGSDTGVTGLMPIDTKKTAFGAFFNS